MYGLLSRQRRPLLASLSTIKYLRNRQKFVIIQIKTDMRKLQCPRQKLLILLTKNVENVAKIYMPHRYFYKILRSKEVSTIKLN